MGFADETRQGANVMMANVETVVRRTVVETAQNIIMPSPVDTGLFKGSWRFTVDQRDLSIPTTMDISGVSTINAVTKAIFAARIGGFWYLQNNQPYAIALENGHSKQAKFMVRNGALAAPYIASEVAREVRG